MTNKGGFLIESIWRNPEFRALPRTAQATYAQLISQKELDRAGVLPYQPTKWVKGCDEVELTGLVADLKVLEVARFIVLDEDTDEVLIRTYMRNAGVTAQPNLLKNALKCARMAASDAIRSTLAAELRRIAKPGCREVADDIDPGSPDTPDDDPEPPEPNRRQPTEPRTHSEPIPNPSETHREPLNPSRTPREPRGESESESERLPREVIGLGGRAHVRAHAHTRGTTPPPQPTRGALALVHSADPDDDPEPDTRCPRHRTRIGYIDEPCGQCADHRRAHTEWTRRATQRAADERTNRRTRIDTCPHCDELGWQLDPDTGVSAEPARRCTHQEPTP